MHFITGASGFVGRRMLELFSARRPEIRCRVLVHRNRPALSKPNIEYVYASLTDKSTLVDILRGVRVVVHCAGVTHARNPTTYFDVNARGTEHLVMASQQCGVDRFILVSSRAARRECGPYGESKWLAERAVERSGVDYIILRLAEVYGEGATEGVNSLFMLVRRFHILPYCSGGSQLAPIFIDDAVKALCTVLEREDLRNRTYTIAGPQSYQLKDILQLIAAAYGVRRVFVPIPPGLLRRIARMTAMLGKRMFLEEQVDRLLCAKEADIRLAIREFGFAPVDFRDMVGWEKERR